VPRKRKRKSRAGVVPLLLAAVLLAGVVWAILPHHRARRTAYVPRSTPQRRAPAPVKAAPSPSIVPAPSAAATGLESPSAVPAASPSTQPGATGAKVAIVIDDCGQWPDVERGYLRLPIALTLAVMPHVRYTSQIAQEAVDANKGVMLHLPMEPVSGRAAGPGEIEVGMTDEQVTEHTEDDLAQVPAAEGFNNHEGSAASADPRIMKDVIAVAKRHGVFFIDSRTSAKTVGAAQAQAAGVPTASRDVFLDNVADEAYTESMLERTLAIAQRKGSAIAIGHPKATTLAALQAMYPKMEAAGVQFVLARDLVR